MVVTCAFYGFINRTTKVTLQVDRETLEVGQAFAFEGDHYVILSVFEADDHYRANVGLEHLHRLRTPARLKVATSSTLTFADRADRESRKDGQEAVLQARLKAAEAKLQDLQRERDEALELLDHAIQQLERLQQSAGH
jgi:DNA-binding transcriptional regulator GbsR (MarR family)